MPVDLGYFDTVSRPILPLIFVVDVSGSMSGTRLDSVNTQIQSFLNNQKQLHRPDYLVMVNILQFNTGSEWMYPELIKIDEFQYISLHAGGLSNLGAALIELNKKFTREEFIKYNSRICNPCVFFITDGEAIDSWQEPLALINQNKWYQNSIKIAFLFGDNANEDTMAKIVGNKEAILKMDEFNAILDMLFRSPIPRPKPKIIDKNFVESDVQFITPNNNDDDWEDDIWLAESCFFNLVQ